MLNLLGWMDEGMQDACLNLLLWSLCSRENCITTPHAICYGMETMMMLQSSNHLDMMHVFLKSLLFYLLVLFFLFSTISTLESRQRINNLASESSMVWVYAPSLFFSFFSKTQINGATISKVLPLMLLFDLLRGKSCQKLATDLMWSAQRDTHVLECWENHHPHNIIMQHKSTYIICVGKVCFSTLNYHDRPILVLELWNRTSYTSN